MHILVSFTCQTCRFYLSELVFTCFYLSIRKILIPPRSGAFLLFLILRSKKKFSNMKTKKSQILKEVVRDVLIVLGLAMVVVAPIAFVLFMMWVQQIVCG